MPFCASSWSKVLPSMQQMRVRKLYLSKISAFSNSTFELKFWILDQNSFKSPSCADIYVDVNKCSIDPWCSPFEIDDVQNNADCQKECQNTNRECRSWIQYYKDDENVGKNDYNLAENVIKILVIHT